MIYTAARPGELAAAKVQDYDSATGTLALTSRKGRASKPRTRNVPLQEEAKKLLDAQAKDRDGSELLLTNNGIPWFRWDWSAYMRDAAKAVELPPDATAYTLRHSTISDWLMAGLDVGTVAKIAGTSIEMISAHYFKYIKTNIADKLSKVALV
jgi:integrase